MAAKLDLLENRIGLLLTFGVARGSFIHQITGVDQLMPRGGSESRSLSVRGFRSNQDGDVR
jgi:hypothetical protein